MKCIVGLGNPGTKYRRTRHNVGFLAIDQLKKEFEDKGICRDASESENDRLWRYDCIMADSPEAPEKLSLVKPLMFMNRSGEAVKGVLAHAPGTFSPMSDLMVLHDELDLALGTIKIDLGSSSAGHNGIQSIIDHLGTNQFIRIRIGIAPKGVLTDPRDSFVLQQCTKEEMSILNQVIAKLPEVIRVILEKGIDAAKNAYNKKPLASEESLSA